MILILTIFMADAFAIGCDCDVLVYSPMTASHELGINSLKSYQLEEYDNYSLRNQNACRNQCLNEFEKDMPIKRLNALLISYTQGLIQEKAVGYNCTGLTTLKFPIRVKAKLGNMSLGNVFDILQVVSHEEVCF